MIISQHQGNTRNLCAGISLVLRVAARHDDVGLRVLAKRAPNRLTGLTIRLRRDRAGVDHIDVCKFSGVNQFPSISCEILSHGSRLETVYLAAERCNGREPG